MVVYSEELLGRARGVAACAPCLLRVYCLRTEWAAWQAARVIQPSGHSTFDHGMRGTTSRARHLRFGHSLPNKWQPTTLRVSDADLPRYPVYLQ